jgi:hypothetical protein
VVTLAAPFPFQDFIYQYGVRCEPLAGDPDELSQLFNDAGGNAYQMVRSMQKHVFRIAPEVVKGVRKALQGEIFFFTILPSLPVHTVWPVNLVSLMFPCRCFQSLRQRSFPAIGMPASGM